MRAPDRVGTLIEEFVDHPKGRELLDSGHLSPSTVEGPPSTGRGGTT